MPQEEKLLRRPPPPNHRQRLAPKGLRRNPQGPRLALRGSLRAHVAIGGPEGPLGAQIGSKSINAKASMDYMLVLKKENDKNPVNKAHKANNASS